MSKFKISVLIIFVLLTMGTLFMYQQIFNPISSVELNENETLKLGSIVKHPKFGSGKVLAIHNLDENGSNSSIQIKFDEYGTKWLMLEFANIEFEK